MLGVEAEERLGLEMDDIRVRVGQEAGELPPTEDQAKKPREIVSMLIPKASRKLPRDVYRQVLESFQIMILEPYYYPAVSTVSLREVCDCCVLRGGAEPGLCSVANWWVAPWFVGGRMCDVCSLCFTCCATPCLKHVSRLGVCAKMVGDLNWLRCRGPGLGLSDFFFCFSSIYLVPVIFRFWFLLPTCV